MSTWEGNHVENSLGTFLGFIITEEKFQAHLACSCDSVVALAYLKNHASYYGLSPKRRKYWPLCFPVSVHIYVLIPDITQSVEVTKLSVTLSWLLHRKPVMLSFCFHLISTPVSASYLHSNYFQLEKFLIYEHLFLYSRGCAEDIQSKCMPSGISSKRVYHQGGSSFTVSRILTSPFIFPNSS